MRMNRFCLAAVVLLAVTFQASAAERPEDKWNLADMYATPQAWQDDAAKLDAQLKEFAACKGHLGDSAKRFKACLGLQADAGKRLSRLGTYANELLAEDTGASASLELNQKLQIINTRANEANSFVKPEVLKIGKKKIDKFFSQDAGLKMYRHPVNEILRAAPHTLDAAGESLVATFGLTSGASSSVYRVLSNAEMPWPTVKLSDGKEVKIDQANYEKYREAPNREDRKIVFDAFWGKWKEFERTFGATFSEKMKQDFVQSKVRKYPDSLARALAANNIPVGVYDQLIAQTNANLPTLHRYFKLRARMLGVSDMRYYDIYPPLVESNIEYPLDKGKQLMLDSLAIMGPEYVAVVKKGLEDRWMDAYPRPRKQSGAHMAGSAYDVHPYVLLNYKDNYASVSTLSHEWGHAMHSWHSNRAQPFITAGYSIFVAEIASTFQQALLLDHVLKIAKSDDERLLYLGSELEGLRGTFFRQAMFAEFERAAHAKVDRGEPLTGASLTKLYGDILRRYHGDKEGVVKIDDLYTIEWAFIPHFYNNYYVYQYATSLAASSQFAQAVLNKEPGAKEKYIGLLSAGGSQHPYEMVKAAGVDLASPAPYQAVAARMNKIMDEIEAILAKKGK